MPQIVRLLEACNGNHVAVAVVEHSQSQRQRLAVLLYQNGLNGYLLPN